jgi:hypothetical protein
MLVRRPHEGTTAMMRAFTLPLSLRPETHNYYSAQLQVPPLPRTTDMFRAFDC